MELRGFLSHLVLSHIKIVSNMFLTHIINIQICFPLLMDLQRLSLFILSGYFLYGHSYGSPVSETKLLWFLTYNYSWSVYVFVFLHPYYLLSLKYLFSCLFFAFLFVPTRSTCHCSIKMLVISFLRCQFAWLQKPISSTFFML